MVHFIFFLVLSFCFPLVPSFDRDIFLVHPDIQAILDDHVLEIIHAKESMRIPRKKYRDGVWQFDWLPGYFVKYDISRIEGMERIKECICKYNLDLIRVPDKRLYHIKGMPDDLTNDNYLVIVKKIEPAKIPSSMTLKHVQQISTIIKKTSFVDFTATNYMRLDDGTLCLIDTEGSFDKNRLVRGYLRLLGSTHDLNTDYTQEALIYVFNQIEEFLSHSPSFAPFTFMRLEQYFARQKRPRAWDYDHYCFSLLKDYTPTREEIEWAHEQAFNK